ncbi:ArsI/CadI family heavy metal resistance metalloenzyme [Embleya scabrispora]|uniref:ArsI/CadI family heavy metal resistance metalloenzyme n=1 Tax=Embleya scabrispora TaxID=159449 RepID=UPI00037E0177|nr:ArsI/CadI family heavy metal resistance metalloenzyme [Embleya scabrispora]MYS86152.1 glyoxalase/bleomycin resistance/dioxygenase family protein [Streptomyces sp. SID5474]
MSRIQLALRVADLDASIAFYTKLFGTRPAKLRAGYANFAIAEPPLKLVLIQGTDGEPTVMDHLGVEVETTDQVTAATTRLADAGLATVEENDTSCCYAVQDKVWVHGPGAEPWEVYVVKGDAATMAKDADSACCLPSTDSGVPVSAPAPVSVSDPASARGEDPVRSAPGGCCG